jgi:hypothetical protein
MALDAVVIHEHTRSQEGHSRTNCRHQARVRRTRRARRHTPAARVALAAESFVPVSTEPALTHGIQTSVVRRAPLLVHRRELPGRRLLVILNMAGDELLYDFSELSLEAELLLSTFLDRENERVAACVSLRGNEGIVLALS